MAHQSPLSKDKVVWSCLVLTFDLHSLSVCAFFFSFFLFWSLRLFFSFLYLLASYYSKQCNPFRPGLKVNPHSGRTYVAESHLVGWLYPPWTHDRNAKHWPHSTPRTKQPFFLLSHPDLATTLHNLFNYSRLEEETDILTSAPLHVKQALFGPSSCTSLQCYLGRHCVFILLNK